MASDAEQIDAIRAQTLARIAEITAAPKPTYAIDGQHVEWSEYLRALRETVAWCERQRATSEPFEVRSRGCGE